MSNIVRMLKSVRSCVFHSSETSLKRNMDNFRACLKHEMAKWRNGTPVSLNSASVSLNSASVSLNGASISLKITDWKVVSSQ